MFDCLLSAHAAEPAGKAWDVVGQERGGRGEGGRERGRGGKGGGREGERREEGRKERVREGEGGRETLA